MHTKNIIVIIFSLACFSILKAQNIKKLFSKADSGKPKAQYLLALHFKQTPELKSPYNNLENYYFSEHLIDNTEELDSLEYDIFKDWSQENYFYYLSESASNGNDLAQFELGKYYESSDNFGSELRAYYWISQSAQQNNLKAKQWIENKKQQLYLKKYILIDEYDRIDFYVGLLNLSNNLCSIINNSFEKQAGEKVERQIEQFLNLRNGDAINSIKIAEFWNNYNKFFICIDDLDSNYITYSHILKKSLKTLLFKNNQQLFLWLFELDKQKTIDFNQIIYFDNQPETILDFLNTILLNPNDYQYLAINDIYKLRNKLILEYDGKTAYKPQ